MAYLCAIWIHSRLIVRSKLDGAEFVVRRCGGSTRSDATVQILPIAECKEWWKREAEVDAATIAVPIERFEQLYESTRSSMSMAHFPI